MLQDELSLPPHLFFMINLDFCWCILKLIQQLKNIVTGIKLQIDHKCIINTILFLIE